MSQELPKDIQQRVHIIVDEYRTRCLWWMRKDYYPSTLQQSVRVLEDITKNCDAEGFKKAGGLRQWLLQNFSETSVK